MAHCQHASPAPLSLLCGCGTGIFNEIVFNAAQEENAAEGLPKDDFDADAVSNQVQLPRLQMPRQ